MKTQNKVNPVLRFILLNLIVLSVLSSCKKGDNYKARAEARDSAYLITKDIYLWPEKLPSVSTFKPRNLADIYEVMEKVKTYQPLDKWSFAETKEETELSQNSSAKDFGFLVKFGPGNTAGTRDLRVIYVYANSSAGTAGVKRTWKVNKINGRLITGTDADIEYINNVFFYDPGSAVFEFLKLDGTPVTLNISKTEFELNTVLYSNVFTKGDRKIGYFVFNEFAAESSVNELVNTIANFQNQGVNEVVVDLRYNRGGRVSTQDTLANMLAPKSVGRGQKVMYTYKFNDKYSSWNESSKFFKTGSLDLSRIVFIVSKASASASELLINNLRPVMDVKLIGETRTYGKPVGFFPIPVYEYNIYPVSFKTVNSKGEGDYYSGMLVDKHIADDLLHDFGSDDETALKEALKYLTTNSFSPIAAAKTSSVSAAETKTLSAINDDITSHRPSATIESRPSRMPLWIRRLQQ